MKLNAVVILALVAGFALYQFFAPAIEHLRGLIDTMVLVELVSRAVVKADSEK
jgi:hypothetical protein